MIKRYLKMITRTEWWRQRNSLNGSWSNHVLRFAFPYMFSCFYVCATYLPAFENPFLDSCLFHFLKIWQNGHFGFLLSQFLSLTTNAFSHFGVQKTSFMLFLNKFDIFEKKVLKVRISRQFSTTLVHCWRRTISVGFLMSFVLQVPLNACEWFKDYQPVSTGKQEIEHAYE